MTASTGTLPQRRKHKTGETQVQRLRRYRDNALVDVDKGKRLAGVARLSAGHYKKAAQNEAFPPEALELYQDMQEAAEAAAEGWDDVAEDAQELADFWDARLKELAADESR